MGTFILQISIMILFQISLKISSLCLTYAQFYSFYASDSITISHLQFKLVIKDKCFTHLATIIYYMHVHVQLCYIFKQVLTL